MFNACLESVCNCLCVCVTVYLYVCVCIGNASPSLQTGCRILLKIKLQVNSGVPTAAASPGNKPRDKSKWKCKT